MPGLQVLRFCFPGVVLSAGLALSPAVVLAQGSATPPVTTAPELDENEDQEPNQQTKVRGILLENSALPGFLTGGSVVLKPRTYYLDRDRDQNPDNEAWALGGAVQYESGIWNDMFQIAATGYTSQKLYRPLDKDGTRLLKTGQEGFTVLGEAYATFRIDEGEGVQIGRQEIDLPYLSIQDIRMVPNTFQAAVVGREAAKGLSYVAGTWRA